MNRNVSFFYFIHIMKAKNGKLACNTSSEILNVYVSLVCFTHQNMSK